MTGIVSKQQQAPTSTADQGWLRLRRIVIVVGIGGAIYLAYRFLKNKKKRLLYVDNFEPGGYSSIYSTSQNLLRR